MVKVSRRWTLGLEGDQKAKKAELGGITHGSSPRTRIRDGPERMQPLAPPWIGAHRQTGCRALRISKRATRPETGGPCKDDGDAGMRDDGGDKG